MESVPQARRRFGAAALAAAAAILITIAVPASRADSAPVGGGPQAVAQPMYSAAQYELINVRSGWCIDPTGFFPGDAVLQSTCQTISGQWANASGNPVLASASGTNIEVDMHAGQAVCLTAKTFPVTSGDAAVVTILGQCLSIYFTGGFSGATLRVASNHNLCLGVKGGSTTNGAAIIWTTCTNATSQQWWNFH